MGSSSDSVRFDAITLSFVSSELEQAFRAEYFVSSLRQIRIGLLFGCFVYAIFGLLDGHLIPESKHAAWFIRYALVCPMAMCCMVFSYSPHFQKHFEATLTLLGAIAGIGIIAMIAVAKPPGSYLYYAGLLLCSPTFYYTFLRLRFVTASCLGWFIFLLYEMVTLNFTDIPAAYFVNNTVVLITFTICGMYICYSMEKYRRSDFLQSSITADHTEQLKKTLNNLEERIQQKRETSCDPVTKLFSRSLFLSVAEFENNKYKRFGHHFSIALLDINNLQLIKDSFGDPVTESVVLAVAQHTTAHLRPYDVPCRFREDGLAILLPETSLEDAKNLAERLRRKVEKASIPTDKGPLSVTVSIGVAGALDRSENSVRAMLDNAAKAILQEKRKGRDQMHLSACEELRSAS